MSLSLRDPADMRRTTVLTFPNVLVTGRHVFNTKEAMEQIAATTLSNIAEIESGTVCQNTVHAAKVINKG